MMNDNTLSMKYWNVEIRKDESYLRAYRRFATDGICVDMTSAFEERAILAFLGARAKETYGVTRTHIDQHSDELHKIEGFESGFPSRSRTVFLSKQEDRDAFKQMLDAIPKRNAWFVLKNSPVRPEFTQHIRGKNWTVFYGWEQRSVLSMAECDDKTAVLFKLLHG